MAGEIELQKYADLVNSVAEPTFVCDTRGVLRLVNPAFLQATGSIPPPACSDIRWPACSIRLPPIFPTSTGLERFFNAGFGRWSGEVFLRRRDGSLLPVLLSLRPIANQGGRGPDQRLALAGTAHDLTEQKRQQAALQAATTGAAARAELAMCSIPVWNKWWLKKPPA